MPVKSIQHPASGNTFKFGRKLDGGPLSAIRFEKLLTAQFAGAASCDYTKPAKTALSEIYENDKLGDCVIAGMAHVVGLLTGDAGTKPVLYSNKQIIELLQRNRRVCAPMTPPPTRGAMSRRRLNYWQNNGAMPTRSDLVKPVHIRSWAG